MAQIIENSFPFKIYEATNAASTDAHVYLGKASVAGINGSDTDFFPQLADQNCFTTFVFASIVGGKCVRVDPATEEDPYIYVDSRWYDFRPCGVETSNPEEWPANSIISSVDYVEATGDTVVFFRNLETDGSIVIEIGDFVWSDQGPQGDLNNNREACAINLKAHKYFCANECEPNGVFARTQGVPGASNTAFFFKSIVGGQCIDVTDNGKEIIISFDVANCNPCIFCEGAFEPEIEEIVVEDVDWVPPIDDDPLSDSPNFVV